MVTAKELLRICMKDQLKGKYAFSRSEKKEDRQKAFSLASHGCWNFINSLKRDSFEIKRKCHELSLDEKLLDILLGTPLERAATLVTEQCCSDQFINKPFVSHEFINSKWRDLCDGFYKVASNDTSPFNNTMILSNKCCRASWQFKK